ncbi:hypothetical protein C0Q70_20310 [Pomacea canaliculata]|uniref:Uncharacterized protein n=1 Tax=Pomacea canaliculata TaxID=400727 RepID=A0A2T7NF62_POMCA|nr:hypothetical protein C0Q70_20310 [Pomacea canaliculata]
MDHSQTCGVELSLTGPCTTEHEDKSVLLERSPSPFGKKIAVNRRPHLPSRVEKLIPRAEQRQALADHRGLSADDAPSRRYKAIGCRPNANASPVPS